MRFGISLDVGGGMPVDASLLGSDLKNWLTRSDIHWGEDRLFFTLNSFTILY